MLTGHYKTHYNVDILQNYVHIQIVLVVVEW